MTLHTRRTGRGSRPLGRLLEEAGLPLLDAMRRPVAAHAAVLGRKVRMAASGTELLEPARRQVQGNEVLPDLTTSEGAKLAALLEAACADGRLTRGSYADSKGVVHFASDVDFRTWRTGSTAALRVTGALTGDLAIAGWRPMTLSGEWTPTFGDVRDVEASTPGGGGSWREARGLLDDLWALAAGDRKGRGAVTVTVMTLPDVTHVEFKGATGPEDVDDLTMRTADLVLALHPVHVERRDGDVTTWTNATMEIALDPASAVLRAARNARRGEALHRLLRLSIDAGDFALMMRIGALYAAERHGADAGKEAEGTGP